METYSNTQDQKLRAAQKQVKKIKGFYIHAIVYVCVNALIITGNAIEGISVSNTDTYLTAMFWGIGLAAHAVSVFGLGNFFRQGWEERKIRELMNK